MNGSAEDSYAEAPNMNGSAQDSSDWELNRSERARSTNGQALSPLEMAVNSCDCKKARSAEARCRSDRRQNRQDDWRGH